MIPTSKSSRSSSEVRPQRAGDEDDIKSKAWCKCWGNRGSGLKPGTWKYQAYLSYLTLGIIYGDIGTSPLYTLSAMFPEPPTSQDSIIGALSLMLWTLIIVNLFKYLIFILIADDHGEGGTFAIFALLSRGLRERIKDDTTYRKVNYAFSVIAILGVAAILADGVLTPAISVMGAIDGLKIASTAVDQSVTVGVSIAILFLFFLPQRFGTSKISFFYSPIIVVWYLTLAGIGIYNISRFPSILQAFNPYWAIQFLGGSWQGVGGWSSLGSAFLTVTGSEALYADLGHFNARAIRTSAMLIVLPSLMLCYSGQAAAMALDSSVQRNAMYLSLPNGMLIPMLILSVLAAIVASQAMVSATFSLVAQAIRLQYLPRLTVKHTDIHEFGQVYVPEVNYFLLVMVLIVVAGYRDVTALGYAYGVTVSLAFLITSFLYSFVIYFCFKRSALWGILFFCTFGVIDANFLAANLTKFVSGGWFSVVVTVFITSILLVWRFGRYAMVQEQQRLARPMSELFAPKEVKDNTGTIQRTIPFVDIDTPLLICFSSTTNNIPAAFAHFLHRLPIRPRNLVFVTISAVNVAFVERELVLTHEESFENVYRLIVYHGYSERPPSAKRIAAFIIRELDCAPSAVNMFPPPTDGELLRFVDPTFVIGHDRVVPKPNTGLARTLLIDMFQALLFFSRPAAALMSVPPSSTLEVGLQVQI